MSRMKRRLRKAVLSLAVATVCVGVTIAGTDTENGTPGTAGTPGVTGNPGTNGTAGGDGPPVIANATSTDATNSASATGGQGGAGGNGGDGSPVGSPGGNGGNGGAGAGAAAIASTTLGTVAGAVSATANAQGGAGGAGGNGGSLGTSSTGAGGNGGNGGNANAAASASALGAASVTSNAAATGGSGALPGGPGSAIGGMGGDAHVSAYASNSGNGSVTAYATANGGMSGLLSPAGAGIVDSVYATTNGNGTALASADAVGGNGAFFGSVSGRSSSMVNVAGGHTLGTLILQQTAVGGNGSQSGGSGGDALSSLTLNDTDAHLINVQLMAGGGTGFWATDATGGSGTVGADITGAHDVSINATAIGGRSGSYAPTDPTRGGAFLNPVIGTSTGGGDVYVVANAYGGFYQNGGNKINPSPSVSAINKVNGFTTGSLQLTQNVSVEAGGTATSTLAKSTSSHSLTVNASALSADNGFLGGAATASAQATNLTGPASAIAYASGGYGAAGTASAQSTSPLGPAIASATSQGGPLTGNGSGTSTSKANTNSGTAQADSSASGKSGHAESLATAANGWIVSSNAHALASSEGGVSQTESRDSVGQSAPASSLAAGTQSAVAFLTAMPTQSDSLAALAQRSIQKDFNVDGSGAGPKSDVLGLMTLKGSGSGDILNPISAQAYETIDPTKLSSPQHILLGLLDPTGNVDGEVEFKVLVNGALVADKLFDWAPDTQTYFTDHTIDEGPLVAGPDGLVHLYWELDVLYAPGPGFSTSFIVANATPNSATPEPGAMCLLGIGLLGLLRRSRQMRKEYR